MTTVTLTRPRAPRAAFGNMVLNEARLAWRQPAGVVAGAGIALLLVVIFGEIPVFRQPSANLGGYSPFDIYIPILMAFSIAIIAFTYLPGPLVSYRELGILRRLTPHSARRCRRSATHGWASSLPRSRCWSSWHKQWCSDSSPSTSSGGNSP